MFFGRFARAGLTIFATRCIIIKHVCGVCALFIRFCTQTSDARRAVRRGDRNGKWKHWKLYFFLFITLPLFIVSLIVKVTETLVRIKLRESAFAVPMETAPVPGEPETSQTDRETKEKPIPIPVKLERVTLKKPGC